MPELEPKADPIKEPKKANNLETGSEKKPICGIVMPISSIDGCGPDHWKEVYTLIKSAAEAAGFDSELVSNSEESGIIQNRIVTNLYSNEMVVCDVSCKNPNVMFELGLRLAFDKPTIVIKDDKTDYSFDTSPIEHITYPRDLRFFKILDFKESLTKKIISTHKKAIEDPEYSTFLRHFGDLKVKGLTAKEAPLADYFKDFGTTILKEMNELRRSFQMPPDFVSERKQSAELALQRDVSELLGLFARNKSISRDKISLNELEEFEALCLSRLSNYAPSMIRNYLRKTIRLDS